MHEANTPPVTLVVEEDPDDLFFIKRRLEATRAKNRMVTFSQGEEALRYLEGVEAGHERHAMPRLMITDLRLLGIDGFEIIEWCRARPACSDMMIVVLTGSENPADEKRALLLGANRYLRKFPSAEMLAEIVNEALAREERK